jgi:hypothetical protein
VVAEAALGDRILQKYSLVMALFGVVGGPGIQLHAGRFVCLHQIQDGSQR